MPKKLMNEIYILNTGKIQVQGKIQHQRIKTKE
jgi:hypothetical protein